ncbi:T7SS effector LXG polymorphic toxin [Virgibacillus senegalensis]|uniref:T7SS effector LXG polymorphic toxin n=1 Tax=Virgibacillus senegalensis TaxID=1499679 RepID=UPI00069D6CA1|nr:T7SS effector LXG polymorphic toxin [Virgibacillus senegalensis]
MANLRINVNEVTDFCREVQSQTAVLKESIDQMEKNIDQIIHMNQFQGEAADAAKEYFQILHMTLLQAFRGLFEQIETNISRHLQDFHLEVDSSHHAIIHQSYLDEKETDLRQSSKRFEQLQIDVKQILNSVSDLSSARVPTALYTLEDKEASLRVITRLSQCLEGYDKSHKSDQKQIESVLQEISSLMRKVSNKTGNQSKASFETHLPTIRSYVIASMETSVFQGIRSPLNGRMGQNTLLSGYYRRVGQASGLQQYMSKSLKDKQGSQNSHPYMQLRLNRTLQQANAWWSQTLLYQTSLAKWQLDYFALSKYKTGQVNNKIAKLTPEDFATVNMSDHEVTAIQDYLAKLESGEIKSNTDWKVTQPQDHEITFEDKREVMGGMGSGSPGGLGGPVSATFDFFTKDIATIIDPNAGAGEKAMASLFTFVKPAKLFDKVGDVAGPGVKKFGNKGIGKGEQVLDKVKTYEQARNKALDLIGDLGPNSQPYKGTLKSSSGYGQVVGRQSADGKVRWRLDYDPNKGPHINIEDFRNGKGASARKIAVPFEGNESTFKSLLKHLNR